MVALQTISGRVDNCASDPASQICTLGSSPHVAIVFDPTKTACLIARSLCTVAMLSSVKHGENDDAVGEDWEGRKGMADVSFPIVESQDWGCYRLRRSTSLSTVQGYNGQRPIQSVLFVAAGLLAIG